MFETDITTLAAELDFAFYVLMGEAEANGRDRIKAQALIELVTQFAADYPLEEALEHAEEEANEDVE